MVTIFKGIGFWFCTFFNTFDASFIKSWLLYLFCMWFHIRVAEQIADFLIRVAEQIANFLPNLEVYSLEQKVSL